MRGKENNMTIAYHVAPEGHNGDLKSLYYQYGQEAYSIFCERWPEAGNIGDYHVHYVHLYDTLDQARLHPHEGIIYAVDLATMEADGYEIERDDLEFGHPVVRDMIEARYLKLAE